MDKRLFIPQLLPVLLFNSLIALFLTILGEDSFRINFIFSQCIGLSIFMSFWAMNYLSSGDTLSIPRILLAIMTGTIIGVTLGFLSTEATLFPQESQASKGLIEAIAYGLLFGVIIVYFFVSRDHIAKTQAALHQEQLKNLDNEKRNVEARLHLLQAQIEPHFLFNTLANILSLIETDPQRGKLMLENFIHYLRATLSESRDSITTLQVEVATLQAYLEVMKIRMGERLQFTIDLPTELADHSFPALLLQPLLENAIKHGLEPAATGGTIDLKITKVDTILRIILADTGVGFQGEREGGLGLANIRQRLAMQYNNEAKLLLEENQPSGLKITLEIPYE